VGHQDVHAWGTGDWGKPENQKWSNDFKQRAISPTKRDNCPRTSWIYVFLIEIQEKQQIVSHFVGELQTIKASGPTFVPTPILGEHEARPNQKTWELTQV
jgi:hypothetical protein